LFYCCHAAYNDTKVFLDDLTEEESRKVKAQYRYAFEKPGIYQNITGISHGITGSLL